MKWLAAITLMLAAIGAASGQEAGNAIPLPQAFATIATNHTITPLVTNATPVTNLVIRVDAALNHTLQVYCLTNPFVMYIDKSVDGSLYVTHTTTNIASGSSTEFALTGKWKYLRVRTSGTNIANGVVNYIGGR